MYYKPSKPINPYVIKPSKLQLAIDFPKSFLHLSYWSHHHWTTSEKPPIDLDLRSAPIVSKPINSLTLKNGVRSDGTNLVSMICKIGKEEEKATMSKGTNLVPYQSVWPVFTVLVPWPVQKHWCFVPVQIPSILGRGDNSCSHVGFVLCRLMSIRLYRSTLTWHVY